MNKQYEDVYCKSINERLRDIVFDYNQKINNLKCKLPGNIKTSNIKYDGPDIEFLSINNGDNLNQVLSKIINYLSTQSTTLSDNFSTTADGTLVYSIPCPTTFIPDTFNVIATSNNAVGPFWVSYAPGFLFVHYSVSPPIGVVLSWNWSITKL